MGSDSIQKTDQTKDFYTVKALFDEIKLELDEKNKNELPVLTETLLLIMSAVETIEKFHKERTEIDNKSVEYMQTYLSLQKYKGAALSYIENQDNEYRDKLYEISGHIVDRISQKALEWGGKTALKKQYEQQIKNLEDISSIIALLKSSSKILNQYVNDQATETLHAEYFKDHRKYSIRSTVWLILSGLMGVAFIWLVFNSITTTPDFITNFISGKDSEGLSLIVLYALFPRIALAVISLFILLAFWKNYQAYKHLEISTKAKLNVAKMMPVLRLNTENHQEYSSLQLEFIRRMTQFEETGFLYQSKTKTNFGSAKIE